MFIPFLFCFLLSLSSLLSRARAQDVPLETFLSRPDITAPGMKVVTLDEQNVGEGFLFLTPSSQTTSINFKVGMYIYNNNGSLVWDGTSFDAANHQIIDFYVCSNYLNAPHLCVTVFIGPIGGGAGPGSYSLILDDTYSAVRTLAPSFVYPDKPITQDLHEFNVVGNGSSALLSSYVIVPYNYTFTACKGSPSIAYIKTGLFTETSTDGQNTTIFHWNALDYVNPGDTYVCPGDSMDGRGEGPDDGFDFFHINAIDKDDNGDYLVSSRHFWTLFKVAGYNSPSGQAPGDIIWRLGGKHSDFTQLSTVPNSGNFNFSFQHHARWKPGGLHFFDNANNAVEPASAGSSSAMGVDINGDNMTATLVAQELPPVPTLIFSQGSHQVLSNGNHFVGMGASPEVFERTTDGTLVFDAYFGVTPMQSYRAFRYPWSGFPNPSEMALFAYALNCGAKNAYHVSWNGATQVASYQFYVSNSPSGGFVHTGSVTKDTRFESTAVGDRYGLYAFAQAIAQDGSVMGQTKTVQTFVPSPALAANCSAIQCAAGTVYSRANQATC